MARTFTPEINRIVRYKRTNGWWRNATITGVVSSTVVHLRFGRAGGTTSNVSKMTADTQTAVWKPW